MAERATTEAEVKEIVKKWHRGIGPDELHDALGWTKEEYKVWAETHVLPGAPDQVIGMERSETPDPSYNPPVLTKESHTEVPDLMANLKDSLDAVRKTPAPEPAPPPPRTIWIRS